RFAERLGREIVLVFEDVVRAEIVQRLFGPRAVGKIGHQLTGERYELVRSAELAHRAEIEEPRFGSPRRGIEIWLQPVAGRGVPLEEVLAFRNPQVDQFAVVTG